MSSLALVKLGNCDEYRGSNLPALAISYHSNSKRFARRGHLLPGRSVRFHFGRCAADHDERNDRVMAEHRADLQNSHLWSRDSQSFVHALSPCLYALVPAERSAIRKSASLVAPYVLAVASGGNSSGLPSRREGTEGALDCC